MADNIHVLLAQLMPGGNIDSRTRTRDGDVSTLAASIATFGLLQPLVVRRRLDNDDAYEIIAGNRRFAALKLLHERGDWPADKQIAARALDVGDTLAAAASLAENFSRLDLHPIEEFEAFARQRDEFGMTPEAIASAYGIPLLEVEQRLALGGDLAPRIRKAWLEGEIDDGAAQAFTLEPDHAAQEKILEQLQDGYGNITRYAVQRALGLEADDVSLLKFVGREAYAAAGGTFVDDLFGGSVRILDRELLQRMAREKTDAEIERLKAAGWSWVKPLAMVQDHWNYGHAKVESTLTAEAEAEIKTMQDRLTELEQLDELDDEQEAEADALPEKIAAVMSAAKTYTPDQMAQAGCFVSIGNDGALVVQYGRVEPKMAAAGRKAAETRENKKKAGDGIEVSNALAQSLSEWRTKVISQTIALNPHIALAALVATISTSTDNDSPIKISGKGWQGIDDRPSIYGPGAADPFEKRLAYHLQSPDTLLLRVLAETLAKTVNVVTFNSSSKDPGADALVAALPIDQYIDRALDAFDRERYFAGISGDGRAAALKAMGSTAPLKGKKADQVAICVEESKRIGWLPPELAIVTPEPPKVAKKATPKAKAAKPAKDKPAPKKAKASKKATA